MLWEVKENQAIRVVVARRKLLHPYWLFDYLVKSSRLPSCLQERVVVSCYLLLQPSRGGRIG